jgi:hypothetical protein
MCQILDVLYGNCDYDEPVKGEVKDKGIEFYILLTVHLDVILVNDQLDALFLNVFISCLYMFRATSAHHQEGQIEYVYV